jgi:DNA (cytosine-5)-methyltransferase 1
MTYYSEIDQYAAGWLENLIAAGHLPGGRVDGRSIHAVSGDDLDGHRECHFFAGIGGWPYALQLAGWPADRPVWTGSCPCQPFSAAGKRRGVDDDRHLWPEFLRLIAECRPPTVFGEQVASKDGRAWLAGVRTDLEALGYAVGAADLCAAGVGAPHIRQRLYWVGHASFDGWNEKRTIAGGGGARDRAKGCAERFGPDYWAGGLADANEEQFHWPRYMGRPHDQYANGRLDCLDGKTRRFEPGAFPLADGVPARVGRLRGYGNAIVPQVAAEFIRAFLDA